MIFERHDRGAIIGEHPNICRESKFDKGSYATDEADVWKSVLCSSKAAGNARIRLSEIHHSVIGEKGKWSEVVGSVVRHSEIPYGRILGSTLFGVEMKGGIVRNSSITNCRIKGKPMIEDADIEDIEVKGMMRVTGKWHGTAPRYLEIDNEYAEIGVTEAPNGQMYIGCRKKDIERWIQGRHRYCKAVGWPPEMADEIYEVVKQWL